MDLMKDNKTKCTHQTAAVRLLKPVRIPARHERLVRAEASAQLEHSLALFEPAISQLKERGITMENAAIEPDAQNQFTLIITNNSLKPVLLEQHEVLGNMEPVDLSTVPSKTDTTHSPMVAGLSILETSTCEDRAREEGLLDKLDWTEPTQSEYEAQQLRALVLEYADVFALDTTELGSTKIVQHSIETGDNHPCRQPVRRIPFALREKVDQMVADMLKQGVIRESKSPWASPIVLVAKKDGSTRFCVDYRRLNSITKMDVFPLPRVDESLDLLANSKYFSTLDLCSGYWQVKMAPESVEKTAFITHSGLYEFTVMPFGLCNAPATFQRLMETVLAGLTRNVCLDYIDDILVLGATFTDHLENLRKVFERLREAGLRLKPSKCHLSKREVSYLGYVVSAEGIAADGQKVLAVSSFPVPSDLKQLRSFLGLASYYRRLVKNFAQVAHPLFKLTRKDTPFLWNVPCQQAFEELKRRLTSAPLLAFPNFTRGFLLETDASGVGLGAVLAQKQDDNTVRPVAYASRTINKHEANYGITELEALGVVWAVKHFRTYLYGHKCDVYTDHEALKTLLNTPHPSGKLARWGLALQELDLTIHYRPGKKNANADALSRMPLGVQEREDNPVLLGVITLDEDEETKSGEDDHLRKRQLEDPELKPMIEYIEKDSIPADNNAARKLILTKPQFEVIGGVLYRVMEKDMSLRIVLPNADRHKVFEEAHGGVFGGHLREAKIHGQLAKHYWWPRMRADIQRWCRACIVCASRNVGQVTRPLLTPIPVNGPFDRVGVDVLKLPKSDQGNQYAVVFVDYLTKWPEVFAVPDQTSLTIARLLVEHVIPRHGVPAELLSDRGKAFLSKLIHEVYELMGIKKMNMTSYHPQTDGLVERFNRTLTDMLAKTVKKGGADWDEKLPYVLYAYRSSIQESTQESPFFLLYGRDPRPPTESALSPTADRSLTDIDTYKSEVNERLASTWELAREQVEKAQHKQKKQHDRHSRDPGFKVGERVFVYMPAEVRGKAYKFARPFRGPYRILRLFENGAEVRLIDKPKADSIRVALNRVRRCPPEITDSMNKNNDEIRVTTTIDQDQEAQKTPESGISSSSSNEQVGGAWHNRLRPRKTVGQVRSSEDAGSKSGEM